MKKARITLCFWLLTMLVLSACGKSDDKGAAATKASSGGTVEATIEDAYYVLTGKEDGVPSDGELEGGLLMIDLQIKNITDSPVQVYPEMSIQMYDEDKQINPSSVSNHLLDLRTDPNNSIGANKQKTVSVVFDVEKDKEYEIGISPSSDDFELEVKETIIHLDTSEYNDSLEELQDPEKALIAFIETIYFDKENSDYEELVSADKNSLQEDAEKGFKMMLEFGTFKNVPDDKIEQYYKSFKQSSAEKSTLEAKVIGNANDKAVVKLNYATLSMNDIKDKAADYKNDYRDKHGLDFEKEDEYALSKFDVILDGIEAQKASNELEVLMIKVDDKWTIDDSKMGSADSLKRYFAEGSVL